MKLPMLLAMGNGELATKTHTGFDLIGAFTGWVQALPPWVLLLLGGGSLTVAAGTGLLALILHTVRDDHAWILTLGALIFGGVGLFLLLSIPF
ncbi:hypothetical protein E1281_38120 [Actinomadura sp. KC345]|uniref:hypothetical protein n=1 Tax=Actinomadura sp. KC345 TaxID=2530371 RepID=UPI00105216C1|nr:hypothetical protein [Actinomadura sp. KC345]TDC40745.1 hypothetical protein E1281_38120 [Actinomadura sp. KC345]